MYTAAVAGSTNLKPAIPQVDRYGMCLGGDSITSGQASAMIANGVQWARLEARWSSTEATQGTYSWTQADHLTIADAAGLKVLGLLAYTPSWARDPVCTASGSTCQPLEQYADNFAAFCAAAAQRYTFCHTWEIWNEPNGIDFWKPGANPALYVTFLKKASDAIKQVDPRARIITGGAEPANTTTGWYSPPDWLQALYDNGAGGISPVTGKQYFDAVGAHPYCYSGTFDCPRSPTTWSTWSRMAVAVANSPDNAAGNLRAVMSSHGEISKPIWATEFGAPTSGTDSVTTDHQAQMLIDAYHEWKSYTWTRTVWNDAYAKSSAGNAPAFIYRWNDIGADFFGIVDSGGTGKPALAALKALTSY